MPNPMILRIEGVGEGTQERSDAHTRKQTPEQRR
jgi:hypothetical protein